jgi:hypothetical protein
MPEEDRANDIPEGMYILQSLPVKDILPEAFVEGSRTHLEKVAAKMIKSYSVNFPHIAAEWKHFIDNIAPKSDDVNEYVKDHPLYIPFLKEAFGTEGEIANKQDKVKYISRSRTSKALPSVTWSRRGSKRTRKDLSAKQSSEIVEGPPGISSSCPIDLHILESEVKIREEFESESENGSNEADSDEVYDEDEYVAVICPARGKNVVKWNYIGCRFRDEDDKKIYRIKNVCKYGAELVYEYHLDGGDEKDVEYSGCDELISEEWSVWLDTPQENYNKKARYYYEAVVESSISTTSISAVDVSAPRVLRSRK